MQLYNKLSAQETADILDQSAKDRLTLSFYKYAHIRNPKLFEEKGDFWRPAERPKKSGSARKWAKTFNAATFGSPRASPERPKRPLRASREEIPKEI